MHVITLAQYLVHSNCSINISCSFSDDGISELVECWRLWEGQLKTIEGRGKDGKVNKFRFGTHFQWGAKQMVGMSVIQLLNGYIWEELGKNKKGKRISIKPLWVCVRWGSFLKDLGEDERDFGRRGVGFYSVAMAVVLTLNIRRF